MFWQGLSFWYDNYGLWPWQAKPRPKTVFMLNSVGHEILNAHKYKNVKKCGLYSAQVGLECININMRPIVGILTYANNCWNFKIYEREKFHTQLS